jgi:hypothetical protein
MGGLEKKTAEDQQKQVGQPQAPATGAQPNATTTLPKTSN